MGPSQAAVWAASDVIKCSTEQTMGEPTHPRVSRPTHSQPIHSLPIILFHLLSYLHSSSPTLFSYISLPPAMTRQDTSPVTLVLGTFLNRLYTRRRQHSSLSAVRCTLLNLFTFHQCCSMCEYFTEMFTFDQIWIINLKHKLFS